MTFGKMDRMSVHLFLYTGVVQKKQKFFCNSVKRQKFTQRIATVVALCYNETERKRIVIDCAVDLLLYIVRSKD